MLTSIVIVTDRRSAKPWAMPWMAIVVCSLVMMVASGRDAIGQGRISERSTAPRGNSQDATNNRGAILSDLMDVLIDSQISSNLRDDFDPGLPFPPTTTVDPLLDSPRIEMTPQELQQASQWLKQASGEMSQLVASLQSDLNRAAGVRAILADAMTLNANAAVLARRLERAQDINPLRPGLRKLDRDWRALDFLIRQTPNLGPRTMGHVARIRQLEQELANLFQMPTQVDDLAITQMAMQIAGGLQSLRDEIRREIGNRGQAEQLRQRVQIAYQQIVPLTQMAQLQTNYLTARQIYQNYEPTWQDVNLRLRTLNNRYILRQAQLIESANQQLRQLLYLDDNTSQDDIRHVSRLLIRDSDHLLQGVTLKMLAELPDARDVVRFASNFSIACLDFDDCLTNGDEISTLREIYTYLVDEWNGLSNQLAGVSSMQARQSMRDIEQSLVQLRQRLGVRPEVDRERAANVATSLTAYGRTFQQELRQLFGRPSHYSREFQIEAIQASSAFYEATRNLEAGLTKGDRLRQLRALSIDVARNWETVTRLIPRFENSERSRFEQFRARITPLVVQLQTLLAT